MGRGRPECTPPRSIPGCRPARHAGSSARPATALDLLYVAPERLTMAGCLELLRFCRIALFAIDEAHCISEWGHDFRRDYQALGILKKSFPDTPVMALTANADGPTRRDIAERLHLEARASSPQATTVRTCSTAS